MLHSGSMSCRNEESIASNKGSLRVDVAQVQTHGIVPSEGFQSLFRFLSGKGVKPQAPLSAKAHGQEALFLFYPL